MTLDNKVWFGSAGFMDGTKNPLKSYSLPVAHMMMQLLAWMWSAIFSISLGSYFVFGMTKPDAIALAKHWGQRAIVWGMRDCVPELVWVD